MLANPNPNPNPNPSPNQGLEFEDFSQMFALSDLAKLTLNL